MRGDIQALPTPQLLKRKLDQSFVDPFAPTCNAYGATMYPTYSQQYNYNQTSLGLGDLYSYPDVTTGYQQQSAANQLMRFANHPSYLMPQANTSSVRPYVTNPCMNAMSAAGFNFQCMPNMNCTDYTGSYFYLPQSTYVSTPAPSTSTAPTQNASRPSEVGSPARSPTLNSPRIEDLSSVDDRDTYTADSLCSSPLPATPPDDMAGGPTIEDLTASWGRSSTSAPNSPTRIHPSILQPTAMNISLTYPYEPVLSALHGQVGTATSTSASSAATVQQQQSDNNNTDRYFSTTTKTSDLSPHNQSSSVSQQPFQTTKATIPTTTYPQLATQQQQQQGPTMPLPAQQAGGNVSTQLHMSMSTANVVQSTTMPMSTTLPINANMRPSVHTHMVPYVNMPDVNQQQVIRCGDASKLEESGSGPRFVDITEYLNLPQNVAAQKLNIPTSTLSKRWKAAVSSNRKWPYRVVSKLDKEITTLLYNLPKDVSDHDMSYETKLLKQKLGALLQERQEHLKPVVILLP